MHLDTRVAQGREYGREVRHHRVIGGVVNFHIAQAVRQTVPNGSDDACGAIYWQRRDSSIMMSRSTSKRTVTA